VRPSLKGALKHTGKPVGHDWILQELVNGLAKVVFICSFTVDKAFIEDIFIPTALLKRYFAESEVSSKRRRLRKRGTRTNGISKQRKFRKEGTITELSYDGLWIESEGVAKYAVNWRYLVLTKGGKLLADKMADYWPKPVATMEELEAVWEKAWDETRVKLLFSPIMGCVDIRQLFRSEGAKKHRAFRDWIQHIFRTVLQCQFQLHKEEGYPPSRQTRL
jgi:hypothetical protein